ncbi:hypothetical protein Lfu02_42590 [Longispora fulva]|uniref:Uncharacterized protein n=1 Tax=Longispora fulva TaxID=619741 RepID=A0A8J7GHH9_9ACTN|nr:hypothetical protein [Longispora fulva]MBG6136717.1 hypothetical protein [Longispora fulva]GIG59887.1 hypothetical protein Lfu02_42590 [Longispora fulva]
MRTGVVRDWAWPAVVAVLAGLALSAAGCEADKPAPAVNTVQPSGSWTLVRWLKSRSDTEAGRGQAVERRLALTPSCAAGKCAVAVHPDGVGGGYLPEGYTAPDADAADKAPYTLSWKGSTATYEYAAAAEVVSCTAAGGTVVPAAYEVTSSTTLTFTPAKDGRPAALRGTYTDRARGVGAGVAAGCTDFDTVWTVAAAPSLTKPDTGVDIAGKYLVTEVVQLVEPGGQRPPGYAGILIDTATVARSGTGYTLSGTGPPPATLAATATGWGGETSTPAVCNLGAGDIAGGFARVEHWDQVRPVATTGQGTPVLTGRWSLRFAPTPVGAAAGCGGSSNTGYVLFVPKASI